MRFETEKKPIVRCPFCNKRLFDGWYIVIEVKCKGCKNTLTLIDKAFEGQSFRESQRPTLTMDSPVVGAFSEQP